MHSFLNRNLAQAHVDERRRRTAGEARADRQRPRHHRAAGLLGLVRGGRAAPVDGALAADAQVRIRYAGASDAQALARLAALDSAKVPASPVLIVEVDGEPWAARSLTTDQVVANPFRHTAVLAELLAVRAAQMRVAAGKIDGRLVPRQAAPNT
jgi:hypothetical protein